MKILHAPENIAGQPIIISRTLRDFGCKSDLLIFNKSPFDYKYDICLDLKKKSIIKRVFIILINFLKCTIKYDIFHFHYGKSLLSDNLDLPILKFFNKIIIMHYWGNDVRQLDISIKYSLLTLQEFKNFRPYRNDEKKRKKIKRTNKLLNGSIVGDYSLLPFSPESKVIKQAIDLSKLKYVGIDIKKVVVDIVHAPSRKQLKGTKYILPIIKKLKKEGYNINYTLIENKTHKEAMEIYRKADIIIDQLLLESYGILAIEGMALGKPVLCRVDDNFIKYYPDLPIQNTDPKNLYKNLKLLIENPKLRKQLGDEGRKYVEKVHDSKIIAKQIINFYKELTDK